MDKEGDVAKKKQRSGQQLLPLIGRGLGLILAPGPGAWQSTWVIVEKCY
jgi:hypothetical protein